jgi:hypothetical protein
VNSIQVKHTGKSGREYRERARYCRLEREGENRDDERENGMGFKRRSALVDFDRWSKSTHKYFWISQIALSTQRYFDTW